LRAWIKSADAAVFGWVEHFPQLLGVFEPVLPKQNIHDLERIGSAEVERQSGHSPAESYTVVFTEYRSLKALRAGAARRAAAVAAPIDIFLSQTPSVFHLRAED
jgi:hypothetical protein